MFRTALIAGAVLLAAAPPAMSQKPAASEQAVVSSTPGKVSASASAEVTAKVVAIDKAKRTLTLKGPQRTVDVVAGDEVKNFDQIKVGDMVVAKYVEALSMELKKTKAPLDVKGGAVAGRAEAGSAPAGAVGRQITALADVVAVDAKKGFISLKGPRGNVFDLKVENPEHFKVVKKGDQVEVVYTEALAVAVVPAQQDAGKAKAGGKK